MNVDDRRTALKAMIGLGAGVALLSSTGSTVYADAGEHPVSAGQGSVELQAAVPVAIKEITLFNFRLTFQKADAAGWDGKEIEVPLPGTWKFATVQMTGWNLMDNRPGPQDMQFNNGGATVYLRKDGTKLFTGIEFILRDSNGDDPIKGFVSGLVTIYG